MKSLKLGCCTDCNHFDIVVDDYPCVSIPLCYELEIMLCEDMLTRKFCRKYEPKYVDVQMRFGRDIQELEGRDKIEAINILKGELNARNFL